MHRAVPPIVASVLALALAAVGATGLARGEPKSATAKPAPAKPAPPKKDASVSPPQAKEAVAAKAAPITITTEDGRTAVCHEQEPQPFLVRHNWFPKTRDAAELREGRKLLQKAIRYRTEQYGHFEGFGRAAWNKYPPRHYSKVTTFMGLKVRVNAKIIPALACVQEALERNGAGDEYKPTALSGLRYKNTYRGVEVSNHVYGIAVDVDPTKNSCCGCVKPWPNHPLCKKKAKSIFERMAMPESWVHTFERFGFYWLGHDVLRDTMHFEFLGDPDKILEPSPAAPAAKAAAKPVKQN